MPYQRSIHPILLPLAAAVLLGAFVTDIFYLMTVSVMWETFSIWLITGGMIIAAFVALAVLFDFLAGRALLKPAWPRVLACLVAVLLSLINAFVHSRDGYTTVYPSGVALSAVVSVIMLYLAWNSWTLGEYAGPAA